MVKLTPELIEGFVGSVLAPNFDKPAPTPEFHRELWGYCCSDKPLVAVAAPRGHAKSTAVSLSYVLAAALFRNRTFILLISDTEGQAKEFLGDIKKELQVNENLIGLFGVKKFVKDTETDIIVEMDDGYRFRIIAKGSEQKVRGLKWNHLRPDLIVCDDIENDEIVMNQDRREKFLNWVLKALLPCRAPHGIVRIVGTILHLDSFLARICPEDGGKYTKKVGLKSVSTNPKTMFHSVVYAAHSGGNPNDIKSLDDILWPLRLQPTAAEKGKSVLEYTKEWFLDKYNTAVELGKPEGYAQEYLNRPLDDSYTHFRRSDFIAITEADKQAIENGNKPLLKFCGVDLAISEKERADWSVFHVVGIDAAGYLYHINTIRERMDGAQIVETLIRLQLSYNLEWIAIEQDKVGKAIGPFLRESAMRLGIFPTIVPIVPSADKQTRMRSIQARMRMQTVRFDKSADYFPVLEQEFLQFPRGRHDDQVDAYSCIGLALDKMAEAPTREDVQEEEFLEEKRQSGLMYQGRNLETGY
jgi:predicted phage terminase large subunit-like protein